MNILLFFRKRIKRFSKWNTLVHVTMRLKYLFRRRQTTSEIHSSTLYDPKLKADLEHFIIQQVLQEAYYDEGTEDPFPITARFYDLIFSWMNMVSYALEEDG